MNAELYDAIAEVTDWLNYIPTSADDLMPDIKRLNQVSTRQHVQDIRERRMVHEIGTGTYDSYNI